MTTKSKSKPSFDKRRREIRAELNKKRLLDRDNSEARFRVDAIKLDSQLIAEGYKLEYETEWGRFRVRKYPLKAEQADMAEFLITEVS